jgi:hypothetical protein
MLLRTIIIFILFYLFFLLLGGGSSTVKKYEKQDRMMISIWPWDFKILLKVFKEFLPLTNASSDIIVYRQYTMFYATVLCLDWKFFISCAIIYAATRTSEVRPMVKMSASIR